MFGCPLGDAKDLKIGKTNYEFEKVHKIEKKCEFKNCSRF
jgi:hypothetical protein